MDERGGENEVSAYEDRFGINQCKREKTLGPKKVKDILAAARNTANVL